MAFFRQPDVAEQISQRYARGVRPQFQAVIDAIKNSGAPALERIQMSGSIATYELALVLRSVYGIGELMVGKGSIVCW